MALPGRNSLRRHAPFAIAAALTTLLLTLAFLQHNWLVQVSEAERQRAHSHLESEAAAFARDFNELIRRLAFDFLPLFEAPRDEQALAELLSSRLERWRSTAAEPSLLGTLWVLGPQREGHDGEAPSQLEVFQLDEKGPSLLRVAALPPALTELGRKIAGLPKIDPASLGMRERHLHPARAPRRDGLAIGALEDKIPALILPLPDRQPEVLAFTPVPNPQAHRPPNSMPFWRSVGQSRWLVLELDRAALDQQIFPQLVARYFPEAGFGLRIVRKEAPSEVIFRSGVAMPEKAKIETTVDLFGPLTFSRSLRPPAPPLAPVPPVAPVAPVAPIAPPEREPNPDREPMPGRPGLPPEVPFWLPRDEGPSTAFEASEGRWQLQIFHEAGSLDALIARTQRRNLTIAFGILLVLGVSMLFLAHAARRAQELARRQMELVAGVSHELLTPLAAMKSAGQNLRDGVVQEASKVSRYGELIVKESDRLSGLVGQVLLWAGLSSQEAAPHRERALAEQIAKASLEDLRPGLEAANFEVELVIAENLPSLDADPAALRQALGNLIANAIKYGKPATGRPFLRLAAQLGDSGKSLAFAVSDHGPGIAAEDLPHLFVPFYRGRKVVASPIAGAGLGLALVRRIAMAHGGEIEVNSAPGRGTTFTLSLPLTPSSGDRTGAAT